MLNHEERKIFCSDMGASPFGLFSSMVTSFRPSSVLSNILERKEKLAKKVLYGFSAHAKYRLLEYARFGLLAL
jgi:hypothetical protein